MAIDPPYRLDPFQNIVNVHWGTTAGYCGTLFTSTLWTLDEFGHPIPSAYNYTANIDFDENDPDNMTAYRARVNELIAAGYAYKFASGSFSAIAPFESRTAAFAAAADWHDDPARGGGFSFSDWFFSLQSGSNPLLAVDCYYPCETSTA